MSEFLIWKMVGWIIVIGIVPLIYFVVRALLRTPEQKFSRVYESIRLDSTPAPNMVFIKFHTYDGFLVWFNQTTHSGYATPETARELLRRLHRYNLVHGLFAAGALLIPILSYFNYRAQLRLVTTQEAKIDSGVAYVESLQQMETDASPRSLVDVPRKSSFRTAIGWLAAALCLMFAGTAVTLLVEKSYAEAVFGILVSILLGKVAHEWVSGIPN